MSRCWPDSGGAAAASRAIVGIQAGLAVIIVGVAVVARALVSLAVCGRGRA